MLEAIRRDNLAVPIFLRRHIESTDRLSHGYKSVLKFRRPSQVESSDSESDESVDYSEDESEDEQSEENESDEEYLEDSDNTTTVTRVRVRTFA
jgi:Ran GTPase-activating protein (RanGAP) involved in mRNA processing and transport